MTNRPEHDNPDDRLYQNAGSLVLAAHHLWDELGVVVEIDDFVDAFIYSTRDFGAPSARQFFDEYAESVKETGEENSRSQRFVLVRLACAHIGEAMRLADDGFREDAWEALLMAQYTISTLSGIFKAEKKSSDSGDASRIEVVAMAQARSIISERARKAADKAHEENRAIRAAAEAWLEDHFFQDGLTNEGAAEDLRTVVPVTFSTRLSYVKKWRASR